jgi:hypothetical protein
MPKHLPFTWSEYEREIGRPFPVALRLRVLAAVNNPTRETWLNARSIVVAPQMGYVGQTLWQCVQAMAMTEFPDERVPTRAQIVAGLCYAAGLPNPNVGVRR